MLARLRQKGGAAADADRRDAVVASYAATFERRIRANGGRPFKASLQTALVALFLLRLAESREVAESAAVRRVAEISRHVLEREGSHSNATDIVGYVWSRAYGRLPIEEPPLIQLGWVLESGARSGAVSGLAGVAWRGLALAAAVPLLNWRQRRSAEVELARRLEYLKSRLAGLATRSDEQVLELHQRAQIAAPAFELAAVTHDGALSALASASLDGAPQFTLEADRPSAHVAQAALGFAAAGRAEESRAMVEFLLEHRYDVGGKLILRDGTPQAAAELSPWIPLGLVAGEGVLGIDRSAVDG